MPTVKDGQSWTNEWVRSQAEEIGLDVKMYWRQPANGIDWLLELNARDAKVLVSIWFLYLKRLDDASKEKIQEFVGEGLKRLEQELRVEA